MCGRFTLKTPASKLIELFQLHDFPEVVARYNISPTQLVVCVRSSADRATQREAVMMRWGLVPFWAKDESVASRMINARSETVAEKPAFRQALLKRRCLIAADGFYEWEAAGKGKKQPWLIERTDQQPFAFAGLWEIWKPASTSTKRISRKTPETQAALRKQDEGAPSESSDHADDGLLLTCTILTTSANEDLRPLHDRMPVILLPENYHAWLSDSTSASQRTELMSPLQQGVLHRFRVSTIVNKAGNESPECVNPI